MQMNSKQPMTCLSSFFPFHFLLNVVIFITSTFISASFGAGNETDHQALLKMKLMITQQDPYGALTSWNNSLHFCDWTGVACGKRHRRVTHLRLRSQGLKGSLSPHVGNLSFLRFLSLSNNSLQGAIPHELGRLSRLRVLYLRLNKFNGVIPANISGCSNLEKLELSYNALVGRIPKQISFLSKLTYLSLFSNKFTGGIPPVLGNITSMEVFYVSRNPLGGSIPHTLGRWKNLREIYLGTCDLYGTIPRSFYNFSLLTNISLAANQLTGSLHPAIGAMFPHLVFLQLWGNQLSGPLPPSISNCSRLRYLETSINKFSGKLTIDFAKLRDIKKINLRGNHFGSKESDEMKFIDSLKNCTKLEMLILSFCKFQGLLPKSIGNLSSQLRHLYLNANQLQGNLPGSIGNLVGLKTLLLGHNQFNGNIPSTIGNLRNLQVLTLPNNQLSGQIPDALGNLSSLLLLSLASNKLEGAIPSTMGNCHRLLELYLNDNKLNGKVPTQLLQLSSLSIKLDLSQNNLSGSLSTKVGALNMLSNLDLSDNNFSGNIPSSIGDCGSLSSFSLKGNFFQGMLPPSLISLKALVELDISRNNLSGKIPKFLGRFKLEYLNMSYNNFEGEVPLEGVFANKSAFFITGNNRLCGDFVGLGLPKCKEAKKHTKKLRLFVVVILITSTLLTIICFAYASYKKKRKRQPSSSSMSDRFLKISYHQLLKATNGFSKDNLIGNGGSSSVYKGFLDEDGDGRYVAVKVLHLQNQEAQRNFTRECEVWKNTRHRNLLRIITSCSSIDFQGNDFKALVYEFMPKGSLYDWLYSSEYISRLNLLQIINILIDISSALDYIHNHCVPTIIHGDLKPSNILLDDDMVAHIGDFGLARLLKTTPYQNSSSQIRGTIGYVAPEYGLGSEMTSSGDVYSFGILLLEVMTGKKPNDDTFNEGLSLHKYASMALPDHVIDVLDVNILNVYQDNDTVMHNREANVEKIEECLDLIIRIGVSCSSDFPNQRMDIKKVVHELKHILDTLQNM